jgi:hypothetical protein
MRRLNFWTFVLKANDMKNHKSQIQPDCMNLKAPKGVVKTRIFQYGINVNLNRRF